MNTAVVEGGQKLEKLLFGDGGDVSADIVAFQCGSVHRFMCTAIDIHNVTRMPVSEKLAFVPGTQKWLLGCIKYTGTLVPIVDVGKFLGLSPEHYVEPKEILIISSADHSQLIGLAVDEIFGLVDRREIAGSGTGVRVPRLIQPHIRAECQYESSVWPIVDLQSLINSTEFKKINLA